MKKLLLLGLSLLSFNWMIAQCSILYVTTTGVPTATGTMTDPMDLTSAFASASAGTVIRIGTGIYTIQNPIMLNDSITIEGGFNPTNAWTKSSLAGATTINRAGVNPEGSVNSQRLVAFYANGISGFRFQDITITTSPGYASGMSTYGVHIDNCANYKFVRTQILPGNGANGANGAPGLNGQTGGVGIIGGGSSCDGGDCTFGSGDAGAAGGNGGLGGGGSTIGTGGPATNGVQNNGTNGGAGAGRNGGAGGGGGAGGDECSTNNGGNGGNGGNSICGNGPTGGARGNDGDPGGDGVNGTNGSTGASGINGTAGLMGSDVSGFWIPGAAGGNGTDACGGTGGSGGGGGGRQVCSFCDNGAGNGGSGGGGGGQGGSGGTGGFGGGASFGLYIVNNGANTEINQSSILAGLAGYGGIGGPGGPAGSGGVGALRNTTCSSEIGEGGAGGNGGAGGVGGQGGNGLNGISMSVRLVSGDALVMNDNNFNLAAQPEIRASYSTCTSNNLTFEDVTIGQGTGLTDWDFGTDATPTTGIDNPQDVAFATTGFKDIVHASNSYTGFINITCESEATNLTETICAGDSFTVGSSTYNATGTYIDVLTTLNGCDSTVTLNLTVDNINSSISLAGLTLTAAQSGGSYQWIDCGNGNLPIGGATNQSYTATSNGSYALTLTFNGCTETSACTAVTTVGIEEIINFSNLVLYPNPTNGLFTINFGKEYEELLVEITDASGRRIKKMKFKNTAYESIQFIGQAGIYFVTISSEDQMRTIRLMKE